MIWSVSKKLGGVAVFDEQNSTDNYWAYVYMK